MDTSVRQVGEATVVSCAGDLALQKGDDLLIRTCDESLAAGARLVVLDFLRLTYIDSAGIGAIVVCSKHAADRDAVIKLVVLKDGALARVLSITQLDRALEVFEDTDSALRSSRR